MGNIPNNNEILAINAHHQGQGCLTPYIVIETYDKPGQSWVVVALDESSDYHRLGIRWFIYDKKGSPVNSNDEQTWFIIPEVLNKAILDTLHLSERQRLLIWQYLDGKIDGNKLAEKWENEIV